MKALLIMLLCISSYFSYSQCNIKEIDLGNSGKAFVNNPEQIADLSEFYDCGYHISLQTYGLSDKQTALIGIKLVVWNVINKETINPFAPREIKIQTSDGNIYSLSAKNYRRMDDEGKIICYDYDVIKSDLINALIKQDAVRVILVDSRKEQSISIKPYNDVFRTQINCLIGETKRFNSNL